MDLPHNNDFTKVIWHSGNLLALGILNRLAFNRRRYSESEYGNYAEAQSLKSNLDACGFTLRTLQNLIKNEELETNEAYYPAIVLLIRQVLDKWYMVHHEWLDYFEYPKTDDIVLIDAELKRWDKLLENVDNDLLNLTSEAEESAKVLSELEIAVV